MARFLDTYGNKEDGFDGMEGNLLDRASHFGEWSD